MNFIYKLILAFAFWAVLFFALPTAVKLSVLAFAGGWCCGKLAIFIVDLLTGEKK